MCNIIYSHCSLYRVKICNVIFLPSLVGEELYTQMGLFVQTILADRYNHRREM